MKKMTIEELAEEYNNQNVQTFYDDKRITEEISVRRIRDYVSKGLLPKPIKEGRRAYYTENHLKELQNIRKLQSEGFTESYLQKNYNTQSDEDLKNKATSALNSIIRNNTQNEDRNLLFGSHINFNEDILKNQDIAKPIKQEQDKWYVHHSVDFYIEKETKLSDKSIEKITESIKKLLKENYHD